MGLHRHPGKILFSGAVIVHIALRDSGKIQAGHTVLINGASGGVGTFMVQLAKFYKGEVTAVCSTRNLELVQSLGADHVIDYTKETVASSDKTYDLVLDNVGNLTASQFRQLLKPKGIGVMVGFTTIRRMIGNLLAGRWWARRGGPSLGSMLAHPNKEDMLLLHDLLAEGVIKSVIDRSYPLAETAVAIRYLETGRAQGKVVVSLSES